MSEMEALLENVAADWWNDDGLKRLSDVLKRRLLPLLEAGQAMRENYYMGTGDTPRIWDDALIVAKKG